MFQLYGFPYKVSWCAWSGKFELRSCLKFLNKRLETVRDLTAIPRPLSRLKLREADQALSSPINPHKSWIITNTIWVFRITVRVKSPKPSSNYWGFYIEPFGCSIFPLIELKRTVFTNMLQRFGQGPLGNLVLAPRPWTPNRPKP